MKKAVTQIVIIIAGGTPLVTISEASLPFHQSLVIGIAAGALLTVIWKLVDEYVKE